MLDYERRSLFSCNLSSTRLLLKTKIYAYQKHSAGKILTAAVACAATITLLADTVTTVGLLSCSEGDKTIGLQLTNFITRVMATRAYICVPKYSR